MIDETMKRRALSVMRKILEISVGSQMEYSGPLLEVVHFGQSVGQVGAKIAVPF